MFITPEFSGPPEFNMESRWLTWSKCELRHKASHTARDPASIHDFHAILHLFGLDHHKLSYRFQGLDFRLTGVNPAKVVKGLIA